MHAMFFRPCGGGVAQLVKFLVEHAEDFKEVVERKQGHSKKLAQKYSK